MVAKVVLALLLICPSVLGNSEPQREALLFNRADSNQDGHLTSQELDLIFLAFDADKDSQVTKTEFATDWTQLYQLGNAKEADTLFQAADNTKDGVITKADLPAIFTYFDMNGDDLVDLNEFLTQWGDLALDAPDTVNIHLDTTAKP